MTKILQIIERASWIHAGSVGHVAKVLKEMVVGKVPMLVVDTLCVKKLMNVKKLVRAGLKLLVMLTRLEVPIVRAEDERTYGQQLRRMVLDKAEATIPMLVNAICAQTSDKEVLVFAQKVLEFLAGGCRSARVQANTWVEMRRAANARAKKEGRRVSTYDEEEEDDLQTTHITGEWYLRARAGRAAGNKKQTRASIVEDIANKMTVMRPRRYHSVAVTAGGPRHPARPRQCASTT